MKKFLKYIIILLTLCYLPVTSSAWGMLGHRIVGEIADSYLKPNARIAIKKILGNESIAMASNWGDFIKSDPAFKYLDNWHYIDFKEGSTYDEVQKVLSTDTSTNAYTKIKMLISGLKSKTLTQEKKLFYLRMLIHVVEDISQPLHVGIHGTEGGNSIRLSFFNESTNLHTIWDSKLINYQQLSYTEYTKAINFSTEIQRAAWIKGGLNAWIWDSFSLSQKIIRNAKEGDKLSYNYVFDYSEILNKQLLKGGVRLAHILNSVFA